MIVKPHDASRCTFNDIPFGILLNGDYLAEWETQDYVAETHIPSTNSVDVQIMGSGLATVTWRLEFFCRADYLAFRRARNTLGTLRVPYNLQSFTDTVETDAGGGRHDVLFNVRCDAPRNVALYVDGVVEADVTFSRAWDPLTDRSEVS